MDCKEVMMLEKPFLSFVRAVRRQNAATKRVNALLARLTELTNERRVRALSSGKSLRDLLNLEIAESLDHSLYLVCHRKSVEIFSAIVALAAAIGLTSCPISSLAWKFFLIGFFGAIFAHLEARSCRPVKIEIIGSRPPANYELPRYVAEIVAEILQFSPLPKGHRVRLIRFRHIWILQIKREFRRGIQKKRYYQIIPH